ncbi:MAG: UDP-glucose/GDP-mannose dehydrogenase family protein [Acidimicrobiia bacterium]|nr:UDP-glucose/GDP-mannose dehydrogenase family protein [Acidimicrobiia bacterium]
MSTTPSIGVIGSGYVGTVVAACFAALGHDVVGIESDRSKLKLLRDGHVPFHETGLQDLLAAQVASGRLTFTDDIASAADTCSVLFVCVGTPAAADGHPDLSALEDVARTIGASLTKPTTVVTKSTVPVGTNLWLRSVIEDGVANRRIEGVEVSIVSCPEFLRVGTAIDDFLFPDRVVIGSDDEAAIERVAALYAPILEQHVPDGLGSGHKEKAPALVSASLGTAELIKYASNSFLAMKISFINELAQICDRVGADVTQVAGAMGMDHRISPLYLNAGLGWGGSCFGKDLTALATTAREHGFEPTLLQAIGTVNDYQRLEVVRKLQTHLGALRGKRIALLGLAFKPGTDDTRDSPAVGIARKLQQLGAVVTAHDPVVVDLPGASALRIAADHTTAIDRADAVVLVTEWPQYQTLDFTEVAAAMAGTLLIDGRNALDREAVVAAGLDYEGIGRRG